MSRDGTKQKYDAIFNGKYRIYIPFETHNEEIIPDQRVARALYDVGCQSPRPKGRGLV